MKHITYEQWIKRFELLHGFEMPPEIEDDLGEGCTFYDNGAVKDPDDCFIVKSGWVIERKNQQPTSRQNP